AVVIEDAGVGAGHDERALHPEHDAAALAEFVTVILDVVARSLVENDDYRAVGTERGRGLDLRNLPGEEVVELGQRVARRLAVVVSVLALVRHDEVEPRNVARGYGLVEEAHVVGRGRSGGDIVRQALVRPVLRRPNASR